MYLYSVIPFSRLPRPHMQKPIYFSMDKFEVGQLVEVSLGRRKILAVVRKRTNASKNKQSIKKLAYALKKIDSAKTTKPVFEERFLKAVEDIADYYFESTGLVLARTLPFSMTKPPKTLLKSLEEVVSRDINKNKTTKSLIINTDPKSFFKQNKLLAKETLFISPGYTELSKLETVLPKKTRILSDSLKKTEVRDIWMRSRKGLETHVAGTRSALFMPVNNLKNLVIENENNTSHKSWDQHPKTDTRFIAEIISKTYNLNLFMKDTVPSLETYWQAKQNKWNIDKKISKTPKPKIIDMREELQKNRYSPVSADVEKLINETKKKDKLLLFISRRGLSSAILCRSCGYTVKCNECDSAMVLHEKTLVCHKCTRKAQQPKNCPKCKSIKIKTIGGGTQKVAEEVEKLSPQLKIKRIDSDTAQTPQEQELILDSFARGEFQVLIGTQAALKEHSLPKLDNAAVIMLDTILNLPTHQSSQQVFEIIYRIKNKTKNPVMVQTYHPELPVFSYVQKNKIEEFFEYELEKRRALFLPPYSQIIKLKYKHKNSFIAEREATALKRKLETFLFNVQNKHPVSKECRIVGPAPAFTPKVKNQYIWQLFIRWPKQSNGKIKKMDIRNEMLNNVTKGWDVDVDPIDIL